MSVDPQSIRFATSFEHDLAVEMSTERARIREITIAAKARIATGKTEQMQRDIAEFITRYEREIKKKIEDGAAMGDTECYVRGFETLEKLRIGATELKKMGFATKECHSSDCHPCCDCTSHDMKVSWE